MFRFALDGAATAQQATTGSVLGMVVPLLLIVVFFYFFMLRPQKKQEREINAMRDNLQIGDEISTNGGIIGRIVKIKDDIITLELGSDKTKSTVFKWAVRAVEVPVNPPEEAPAPAKKAKKKADTEQTGKSDGTEKSESADKPEEK